MSIGREIIRLASVPSTMDVVDEYARAGAAEGLIVVADEQTAGRGRSGRTWLAAPGSSLLCSTLLRPQVAPERLGPLPLSIGVAVAVTIESFIASQCGLKWPNDVLLGERKVAGILLQSRLNRDGVEFVNAGIGININASGRELPDGATSLSLARGAPLDRDAVLSVLIRHLSREYAGYLVAGGSPGLSGWKERAVMLGRMVTIRRDGETLSGTFADIDADGRLVLERSCGKRIALSQGEIVQGPRLASSSDDTLPPGAYCSGRE